ncbi:Uncharacterised protein [Mycobacteroides abscessus subsp. massiliense]|nr:Uncharacterised protein [Mycobacteroides abscessus subsp. massiliense]SKK29047.1 Uncharacterised protein [Mycobacteroides abscessus subsp. massiliense]SKK51268.1 Uncharacterised protein [Mycobacteroides abscessus subsp. massiliense]
MIPNPPKHPVICWGADNLATRPVRVKHSSRPVTVNPNDKVCHDISSSLRLSDCLL